MPAQAVGRPEALALATIAPRVKARVTLAGAISRGPMLSKWLRPLQDEQGQVGRTDDQQPAFLAWDAAGCPSASGKQYGGGQDQSRQNWRYLRRQALERLPQ